MQPVGLLSGALHGLVSFRDDVAHGDSRRIRVAARHCERDIAMPLHRVLVGHVRHEAVSYTHLTLPTKA